MAKTLNGTGTTYLGVGRPDFEGWRPATLWFVFLGMPLLPLRRVILRPVGGETRDFITGSNLNLEILSSGWIRPLEVLLTYVVCWALILPAALGPFVLVLVNFAGLGDTWIRTTLFAGSVIWLLVVYIIVKVRKSDKLLAKPWSNAGDSSGGTP